MKHVDALSRVKQILVIEENSFEINLGIKQGEDEDRKISKELEKPESRYFELHND